jgi:hypothetical protein
MTERATAAITTIAMATAAALARSRVLVRGGIV